MEENNSDETKPKLKVNRDAHLDESSNVCPSCGAAMEPDAILCVQCGHDLRSGNKVKTSSNVAHTLFVIAAAIISLLIAAVAIVVLINFFRPDRQEVVPPTTEPAPVVTTSPPEEPAPMSPEPDPPSPDPQPVEEPQPDPVPPEPEAPTPPETPSTEEIEPDEAEEEAVEEVDQTEALREELRRSLDERIPMVEEGDDVALRRINGFVHRGTLVGIRDGQALVVAGDIRERVPLNELDRESRILVDVEFRERMIESRLRAMEQGGSR